MRHQAAEFDAHKDAAARALWWEPGTGKTKAAIDTAFHLWEKGEIQGVLVVAPGGVHRNWAQDELPAHAWSLPRVFLWSSDQTHLRSYRADLDDFLAHPGKSLDVFCLTYDGLMTSAGGKAAKKFLQSRRCLYVADETGRIKNPAAKVTKRVLASAPYAPFRRALNGTPVSDSPFQAYSQVKFVDPTAWKALGIRNYGDFKGYFGKWEKAFGPGGAQFPKLVGYDRLDELNAVLESVGTRVRKDDVLDLPPKTYIRRYFSLSPAQRKCYDELREDFRTQLSGATLTAENALTWLTRLQQAASGRLPTDEDSTAKPIDDQQPRVDTVLAALEEFPGQAIIWAKFTFEVDAILAALKKAKISACRYDGEVDTPSRAKSIADFKSGTARCFVAKATSAGYGLTLVEATTVIYASNLFSLDVRLQSEDRSHRRGQTKAVTYVDCVAERTVDEKIIEALRTKRDVSLSVNGDTLAAWI